MKNSCLCFLLILFSWSSFASVSADPVLPKQLKAQRNNTTKTYRNGQAVSITYGNNAQKTRGFIRRVTTDSVYLIPIRYNKSTVTAIAISSISKVVRLHRYLRKEWIGIVASTTGLLLTTAILFYSPLGSTYIWLFPLLLAYLLALMVVPWLLAEYLLDIFQTRSTKNNWRFFVE
jgi:hypothetical protein